MGTSVKPAKPKPLKPWEKPEWSDIYDDENIEDEEEDEDEFE